MKYIVTRTEEGREDIFVFPSEIHHDAMAEMIGRIKNQTHGNWKRIQRTPVSAGFVGPNFTCYGRSETLNLDSRPQDTELMRAQYS